MVVAIAGEHRKVPMSEHTTWRCGGAADCVYAPSSLDDLSAYLAGLEADVPLTWLGRGSNVLVRDGGMRGVVIQLCDPLSEIVLEPPKVQAQGGASCARLAIITAAAGWSGLEFLAGIPGTVGGALAMNAGAAGSELWDFVESIETVDRQGDRHEFPAGQIKVGYRFSEIPAGHGVVAGTFRLEPAEDPAQPERRLRELMDRRRITQPVSQPSGGSVFRNPPDGYAARLIEEAGLKGCRIGGAEVSRTHANFIVHGGKASAADIERLIEHVRDAVEEHSGVRLELEVRILGEAA